ncbi:MAG: alginate export family protein [Parafilimonas sp.]|nr:alginate export family protein [Parafilimonas sp.]
MKHSRYLKLPAVLSLIMLNIGLLKAQTTTTPSPLDTVKKPVADTAVKKPATPQNTLTFGLDMRARSEWRHGYKSIPTPDTTGAFQINQRTRFNVDYRSKVVDVFLSLQDARVWGQQDPREGQTGTATTATPSTTFPIYFFEAYAEPHFNDKLSLRIGRQRISYDNQRLFSENNWRLPGNSFDAARLIYNNKINFATELVFSYQQSGENIFTTKYYPLVPNYKSLVVHYLNWKLSDKFALTTINAMDGYQSSNPAKYTTTYQRLTSGGRLEYSTYSWYLTMAAYKQYGKDSTGKKIDAYYLQPEIKFTSGNFNARLGMEYMSGQDSSTHPKENKSFSPLYGTAHSFMGYMDIFDVPSDFNNAGMINPYLIFQWKGNKVSLLMANHVFMSQSQFVYKGDPIDKYLGFENDWKFNYTPNKVIDWEVGFNWAKLTHSATIIKKSGDASSTPYFIYTSIRFTPTLGKITF